MALAEETQSRAGELLAPISEAEPAGQNASYDPRYEEVRNLMASLDSPTGGEVEWPDVAKSTRELLTSTTKDMLVASYACYALLQTEGPTGLAIGIATIEGLLTTYWDSAFPPAKRLRARGNALGWLTDRLERRLPEIDLQPSDRLAIDLIDASWKQLGGIARDKLEDHCPSMSGVTEALTRIKLKLPEAPKPAAPASSPPSDAAAAPAAPEPPPPLEASEQPAAASAPPPTAPAPVASAPAPTADPLEALREEAKAWTSPISEAAPCGEDPRYDEAYETCRVEITQLDAPTGGDPDWKTVRDLSGQVLQTKGKDLLMASYFAFARYQADGLDALPLGLVVVEQILEQYTEGMFPIRPRGRGNAVGWLVGHLEPALGRETLEPGQRETLMVLNEVVKALATSLRGRLDDQAPPTSPMTERMQRMLLALPKPEPKPEPKPQQAPPQAAPPRPAAPTATPSVPMPATTDDVGSAEEVNRYLLETGRGLVKAAGLLRRAELKSPAAYRLLRAGLWLHLHKTPPADAGGKTQIPPLPAPRRGQFQTIASNGKWAALIEETESALMQFRFCLDLNRMTDQALEGLGDDFAPARAALAGEVATLVRRMPDLLDFTAGDGSPLADDETKAWIATLAGPGDGGGGGGGESEDKAAMADVRGQMAGKPTDAIKLARQRIDEASTPRSRFVRQLTLAEIFSASNQPQLARGMFAALERDMTARDLLTWEPDLASRCLEGLVRSIRAANKAGGKHAGADEAFERLCLVDPAAAARLSS